MAKNYPIKKHFGLTQDQAIDLADAAEVRSQSESFLMREYISNGSQQDLASWEAAQAPKTGDGDE